MERQSYRRFLPYVMLATLLIVTLSLTLNAWAAPSQSPLRQSVPTKTPLSGGENAAKNTPAVRPTATPIPTFTPEPVVVAQSGGGPSGLAIGGGIVVVGAVGAIAFLLMRKKSK